MKLVATWLKGVGLEDAAPNFEAAGIVTPSALAELDVNHFEALGVSEPEDRRKLFFLVQRIKLAVQKGDSKVIGEGEPSPDGTKETKEDDASESESGPAQPTTGARRSKRLASKRGECNESDNTETAPVEDTTTKKDQPIASRKDGSRSRQSSASLLRAPKSRPTITPSSSLDEGDDAERNEAGKNLGLSTPNRGTFSQSKLQAPRGGKGRRESKLHNPSISMRTGKSLSAIPAERIAPQSPLIEFGESKLNEEDSQRQDPSQRRARRRSRSRESLDSLLASSTGDSSEARPSESDSESSVSGRRKSFSRSGSRSGSLSTSDSTGPGLVRGRSRRMSSVILDSNNDSFKMQIEELRQDVASDFEMFANQYGDDIPEYDMRIRVIVRKRPLSKAEVGLSGGIDVIHPLDYGEHGRILVYQPKTKVDLTKRVETVPFSFDNVFGEESTNQEIYRRSVRGLIPSFFKGGKNSVFGYGQTGSGKTYTMMGSNMTGINAGTANHDDKNLGLYYLAALDIFQMARRPEYSHMSVTMSLFEIYGGKLYDLMNVRKQVKCLEDSKGNVCFRGLTEHDVENPDQLMDLIEEGAKNRSTGTTSRNADSSRSHAVIQLALRKTVGRKKRVEHGRLTFIDLAGSERGADTSSSSRATRLEGAEINTSLLALKEVIRALATGGSMTHIPFRGSKLTQVLKDRFVGSNSRCCMVACISPDIGNCEQTLNTLRYADRVKERDPETGALASGVDVPVRVESLQLDNNVSFSEGLEDDEDIAEVSEDGQLERNDSLNQTVISECNSDILNELLASEEAIEPLVDEKDATTPSQAAGGRSAKLRTGEELIRRHRSIMSSMLVMVKEEMTLVNRVDADRDGLDEYLAELERMQQHQLSLISKLQDSLHTYVASAEKSDTKASSANSPEVAAESDDEFEDLRDL